MIDLAADAATLDPQLQWDTDSYSVYRNIFDNLLTRDTAGTIVPQVAAAWHYANETTLVFDLRTDIIFQDGTKLTPEDVAFSVTRIIDPALRSSQLSQFDQIASAEITGPAQVTLHTKSPYPALLAQLVKLSIVPKAYVQKLGNVAFNQTPMGSGPYRLRQLATRGADRARRGAGLLARPPTLRRASCSAPCPTCRPGSPTCAPAGRT